MGAGQVVCQSCQKGTEEFPFYEIDEADKLAADECSAALEALLSKHKYLRLPGHELNKSVVQCQQAIKGGRLGEATAVLRRIESEVEQEEETLAVIFSLFKPKDSDTLTQEEVHRMLEYLGFPDSRRDVVRLLAVADRDGDRRMNLDEFREWVGSAGGAYKLFEMRRLQGSFRQASNGINNDIRFSLEEAGIMQDAQLYWRLVVPDSELVEASKLTACQKRAIAHIRRCAKHNHDQALPKLQQRVKRLGFNDNQLWQALAWIRESAPILIHVNLTKMLPIMERDTHYRNLFETGTSGGNPKRYVRERWEKDLFGDAYGDAKGVERPKYGVMNVTNDYRGVINCKQYGDSYLVLKDVRLRCTLTPEDSANLRSEKLAVPDHYAHVLNDYNDAELRETLKVGYSSSVNGGEIGESRVLGDMRYKEAQIHGEICFAKHVERLVASMRHNTPKDKQLLMALCEKHGWQFSWMDDEKERLKAGERSKVGPGEWRRRLEELERLGAVPVVEGCCKMGCGRLVAPGLTESNRPFQTCCRGCAMGFGHDLICGEINPELLGPGRCKNGCGRPVAPGSLPSGRKYTTCCRGCASGTHDAGCGGATLVSPRFRTKLPAVASITSFKSKG